MKFKRVKKAINVACDAIKEEMVAVHNVNHKCVDKVHIFHIVVPTEYIFRPYKAIALHAIQQSNRNFWKEHPHTVKVSYE